MFLVTFEMQGKPETRLEIIKSLQGIAENITKLDGCVNASIYQHVDNEHLFFFVEEWGKQRSLDDHLKSSLFQALLGIDELLINKPEIMFMKED